MSVLVITAVQLDANGKVVEALCGKADPATNQYLVQPAWMKAHEVAGRLYAGDRVFSVFSIDGSRVLGPEFRYVRESGGHEGIVLEEDARFSVHDLVQSIDQDNAS
jgi:hypothetical protein